MPLYDFICSVCGKKIEKFQHMSAEPPNCCEKPMSYGCGSCTSFHIKGLGYNSRRKWMDNWTPESKPFSTGSLHGEKY